MYLLVLLSGQSAWDLGLEVNIMQFIPSLFIILQQHPMIITTILHRRKGGAI